MKKIITLGVIVMFVIIACKKDKQEVSLKGKWNVETVVTKEYFSSILEYFCQQLYHRYYPTPNFHIKKYLLLNTYRITNNSVDIGYGRIGGGRIVHKF